MSDLASPNRTASPANLVEDWAQPVSLHQHFRSSELKIQGNWARLSLSTRCPFSTERCRRLPLCSSSRRRVWFPPTAAHSNRASPVNNIAKIQATSVAAAFVAGSTKLRLPCVRYMAGIMAPLVESGLTVGERDLKFRITRSTHWVVAVYLPCICIAFPAVMVLGLYEDPIYTIGSLWRVPVIMLWGVFMAMVAVVRQYMSLFMAHAPYAVQEAIFKVGLLWIAFPALFFIVVPVVCFGKVWMLITTVCLFCIQIAGVWVFWEWLVRAYPK
ncbi:hypothetical protein EJB05_40720, partial [Eragrostis curvula]